jgi:transcriptional regulator with XRE-family HTH domain
MPAPAVTLNAEKPMLLPVGQELLRRAMEARGLSVTALAATLGVSRKHLSNVLNGHASPSLALLLALDDAVDVDAALLVSLLKRGRESERARSGAMKGWIIAHGDLTEPMEGWEMLED